MIMAATASFDINREFFIIDSLNLHKVSTRLYGFALVNCLPVTSAEDLAGEMPTGDGAYVYVHADAHKITVMQDFIGSYGLYLYQDGDYFALSNSFFRLVEHIKGTHPITLNRDYATAFLPVGLCAVSFSDTMVNEIRLLGRNTVIEIPLDSGVPELGSIDYLENTLELSSAEGIALLDSWYEKWTGMIRNLAAATTNIQVDLSGGFDSRIILSLLLGSGIDMKKVFVNSIKDELHTHREDYEIASAIADHYDFPLNNHSFRVNKQRFYTQQEVLDISYYLKLGFHKQMYYRIHCLENSHHYFGGSGGECVRDYWNTSEEEYIESEVRRCKSAYGMTDPAHTEAVRRHLRKTFDELRRKYSDLGRPIPEEDLSLNLYRETRCRNHFGKDVLENMFGNSFKYTPLLDPQLHRLKLTDSHCKDRNLLMALILARYNPDLLEFKFDSGRFIDPATIVYAKTLSGKYPYCPGMSSTVPAGCRINPSVSVPPAGNPRTTMAETVAYVKEIFLSRRIRGAFTSEFDPDIFDKVSQDVSTRTYQPLQGAHTVIAISKVIQDCALGENLRCGSVAEHLGLDVTPGPAAKEISLWGHESLAGYITARVDISNDTLLSGKIEIQNLTDTKAKITNPKWLQANGYGYVIESQRGSMDMDIVCHSAGVLHLRFRGKDVRNADNARIPCWIDLTAVTVNEKSHITQPRPIWHDAPLRIMQPVSFGQTVHLHMEWLPHDERKNPTTKK